MTHPDWRAQPRHRPVLPPRAPEDVAAWHAVVEREWLVLWGGILVRGAGAGLAAGMR